MTPSGSETVSAATADRVAAILLLLFAGFVILEARAQPYWTGNAPGPGFLPFWLGVLLACGAAVLLVRTRSVAAAPSGGIFPDRPTAIQLAIVVALTVVAAAAATIVGFVLVSALFMGATLAYLRPGHTRSTLAAAVLTPLVVWLVFVRWLAVPLPAGPLGF